jgi:hypothetical protein
MYRTERGISRVELEIAHEIAFPVCLMCMSCSAAQYIVTNVSGEKA